MTRLPCRRLVATALAVLGALAASAAAPRPAPAQSSTGIDAGGSDAPIEIDAEQGIEWRRDEKVYIARGKVRAARGELAFYADTLTARYRDEGGNPRIFQIEATGAVRLSTDEETVFADRAVYNLDKDVVVFQGTDLRIETPNNTISARDALEYWTKRRVLVARGDALAVDNGRQVRADLLTGYFKKLAGGGVKLYQVEAVGNVRLTGPRVSARSAKAVYDLEREVATLSGGVRITRGEVQLSGASAELDLRSGVSRLIGAAGQKVHTLIVPSDKPKTSP